MESKEPEINIPNIEKELGRLLGAKVANGQSKACLFTLVIYAGEARRVSYLEEQVNNILDKFPCRIIFIQSNPEASSSYFRVSVSTVMSGQVGSGSTVACDQIVIEASKDQLFRAPFLVIPHLVPDLPVYLLWGENPFEERDVFPSLQPFVSRVVFDSECSDSIKAFCEEMETSLDKLKVEVMDINWALISNWRDTLFQLFDSEERIEHLADTKTIIINYNASQNEIHKHPEIRALYLQAWLAASMGWKYHAVERSGPDLIITYMGEVHPVVIALSPKNVPSIPSGAITNMDIHSVKGFQYSLSRKETLPQVVVHVTTKETCDLPFTLALSNVHRGTTFMKEIFFKAPGANFREALMMISNIDPGVIAKSEVWDGR